MPEWQARFPHAGSYAPARTIPTLTKKKITAKVEVAYHQEKYERGFDRIIDVLGADHSGHVPRIRAGVHLLGVDVKKLEFVLVQMEFVLAALHAGQVAAGVEPRIAHRPYPLQQLAAHLRIGKRAQRLRTVVMRRVGDAGDAAAGQPATCRMQTR